MLVGDLKRHRPIQPEVQKLRIPNQVDIDFRQLHVGRLARLQNAMRANGVAIMLLYNPANIRYATGTDFMGIWTHTTLCRYCVVTPDRAPIMFEYGNADHISDKYVDDIRPSKSWQMMGPMSWELAREWAAQVAEVMAELGCAGERLALDKIDVFGIQALEEVGVKVVDAGLTTVLARQVKTREEVQLCQINGAIGDAMMAAADAAIRPGLRDFELLAVLSDTLYRFHGEYMFTRVVASGRNTNPWLTEAHDKIIQPGDLVGIDTDANGFEGYVIDASRTFLCGEEASDGQKEAYRIAYDCVCGMVELAKPGLTYEDFARQAPELPDAYKNLRYVSMSHPTGLEDESPGIPYPYPPDVRIPEVTLEENMVLTFECFAGKEGAHFGVKLEEQVVITADGCARLSTYPFEPKLL